MQSSFPLCVPKNRLRREQGSALIIMLVILVMGFATILVSSLSQTGIMNLRDDSTAKALVQAKDALIGYAVSDLNRPGELPCPDTGDDEGSADLLVGNNCAGGNLGRLPWRTLGLPELLDGSGEHLWYAVSDPFHAGSNAILNSDSSGTLTATGNVSANNLLAIVFAPGTPLAGQSRAMANKNTSSHYLESVITAPTTFQLLAPNDHSGGNYDYNDHALVITHNNVMPLVERRIAREVKTCLDDYAAASNNKYPWATRVTDNTYRGRQSTRFGRIAKSRLNVLTNDSDILNYLDAMYSLQTTLNTYNNNPISTNLDILKDTGQNLKALPDPGISNSIVDNARNAGETAKDLDSSPSTSDLNSIQQDLSDAFQGMGNDGYIDSDMNSSWNCPLLNSTTNYWSDWKPLVFYQLSTSFDPGSPINASCGSCLSISGSGNLNTGSGSYRATVVLARKMRTAQSSRDPLVVADYLEEINQSGKGNPTPTLSFETYKSSDPTYATVNDLVLCLDGKNNCK